MKVPVTVFLALSIVACGQSSDPQAANSGDAAAGDMDFCSCVNEPLDTSAKLAACGELMESMTPAENSRRTFECREALPVPKGGPDLCFCLRTATRDAALLEQCEAIIPDDMTPREFAITTGKCTYE